MHVLLYRESDLFRIFSMPCSSGACFLLPRAITNSLISRAGKEERQNSLGMADILHGMESGSLAVFNQLY